MCIIYVQQCLRLNRIMISCLWIYGEAFLFFHVGGVFSELALFCCTLAGIGGICLSGAVCFLLLLTDLVKQEIQRLCQINTVQVGPIYVGFMVQLVDHNVVYNSAAVSIYFCFVLYSSLGLS